MKTQPWMGVEGGKGLRFTTVLFVGLMVTTTLICVAEEPPPGEPSSEVLPPGVEQLLPRGKIAAIDDPTFVSASEAEIADDAWVLGVLVEGQAKAYSLNLLNRHEVVNDREGSVAFAAVW